MYISWRKGRKTVTRRLINPQPDIVVPGDEDIIVYHEDEQRAPVEILPYYRPGEIVCPVGPWSTWKFHDGLKATQLSTDCSVWVCGFGTYDVPTVDIGKVRPGRFLPTQLEPRLPKAQIISVRAERLSDITCDEALKEGASYRTIDHVFEKRWSMDWGNADLDAVTAVHAFMRYWGKIHGQKSWESDPWVWRVELSAPMEGQ